eukprot:s4004_g2.t1
MDPHVLGQDDFGSSCEDLTKLAAAMTKAAEDEEYTAGDVWATARQGLRITAAYVADRSEDDQVALCRLHALLHAAFTLRLQDRPAETLTMHPKYSDQVLIRCHVPAQVDAWQRCLRHAAGLIPEVKNARRHMTILAWQLSRNPTRKRDQCWLSLSCYWLKEVENCMRRHVYSA